MSFPVESVICPLAGTCMRDNLPTILLFLVTWVEKMTCWASFKGVHCPGKGSDQYFYLWCQGWKLCIFAQQVIFWTHVTKNNIIVGKWSRMQVPANGHMTDSTENDIKNYFLWIFRGFQWFFKKQLKPVYRTVDGLEKTCEKRTESYAVRRKMVSFKLVW